MASSTIPWGTGTGNIYLTYTGAGNGSISVTSDPNPLPITRVQTLVVRCPDYPFPSVVLNVWQAPGSKVLQASFDDSFDLSYEKGAVVPTEYTARLVPSAYAVSSASYLSVSNASRMYNNTDNTTYATITNTYASTSSRYLYLRGFNFGSIPAGATIKSFVVKIKGKEGGLATSTSYAPRLANGTSALSGTTASQNFGTSVKTIEIPTGALTWSQIKNYGSDFTIMVYVRRNSRNTTGYAYIYGAEIEVKYEI